MTDKELNEQKLDKKDMPLSDEELDSVSGGGRVQDALNQYSDKIRAPNQIPPRP